MKKILGIGNALVDVMTMINDDTILAKFELPKGSMSLVNKEKSDRVKSGTLQFKRTMTSGGSAANTVHGIAMMGTESGFIGSIGSDDVGDFFEKDMQNAGIKTMLIRRKTETGTAVALISADTERTFATHLGAAVELAAIDLLPQYFEGYDILYMEGYLIINKPLVETACRMAKERNMKIALDLASFNVVSAFLNDFSEIIEKYVDIVFANEEEAKSFTGKEPEEALNEISKVCEVAVVKAGKDGSWIKRGEEKIRVGTGKVKVRDTTGAGDLYASGFLFGYSRDLDLATCGAIGSLLAGKVIGKIGARMDKTEFKELVSAVKNISEAE